MQSSIAHRFLKSPQKSSCRQRGFATAAKALVVALGVTGVSLVATTGYQPRHEATATSAVAVAGPVDATQSASDPDAELREWLREPQPPTF